MSLCWTTDDSARTILTFFDAAIPADTILFGLHDDFPGLCNHLLDAVHRSI